MKYEQVYDGDWIRPMPQKGHKMTCCDCGLIHTINYRIRNGKVEFQAFRDSRATGQRRRKFSKGFRKELKNVQVPIKYV